MECESESEEEIFLDSLSHIEEIETLEKVNREVSETIMDGNEYKFDDELFKEVWGNIHTDKAIGKQSPENKGLYNRRGQENDYTKCFSYE